MKVALIFCVVIFAVMQSVYSFKIGSGLRRGFATPMRTLAFNMMASVATSTAPMKLTGKTAARQLLDKTDCFIFDCDGVIWKGAATTHMLFISSFF